MSGGPIQTGYGTRRAMQLEIERLTAELAAARKQTETLRAALRRIVGHGIYTGVGGHPERYPVTRSTALEGEGMRAIARVALDGEGQ